MANPLKSFGKKNSSTEKVLGGIFEYIKPRTRDERGAVTGFSGKLICGQVALWAIGFAASKFADTLI